MVEQEKQWLLNERAAAGGTTVTCDERDTPPPSRQPDSRWMGDAPCIPGEPENRLVSRIGMIRTQRDR